MGEFTSRDSMLGGASRAADVWHSLSDLGRMRHEGQVATS
jgi:hypothetical protein